MEDCRIHKRYFAAGGLCLFLCAVLCLNKNHSTTKYAYRWFILALPSSKDLEETCLASLEVYLPALTGAVSRCGFRMAGDRIHERCWLRGCLAALRFHVTSLFYSMLCP